MNEEVQPVIRMLKTEGNGPSYDPSRRFQFGLPVNWSNEWAETNGSTDLLYEPGVDTNLRAAWVIGRRTDFRPFADGSPNVVLRDQNDYSYMKSTLDCTLGITGGCPSNL